MSTALYRRYRPDTFEEVIGQRHVTDALQAALGSGRIAHAFLFSGPRGCGKTTSARILARCLNCAQGPTATPCGVCESCVELASGGPGSLDVVEIDAASHSSVNDTRELRDKVNLAPVRDRYRVFILDEAHMVSAQGFNALLKVVEEPPEHVKFIFATTDPDKVINTIRSRTHHYPFRLVAPAVLVPYLHEVTDREGIDVEEGVYPLVVRSGGGSVRDSLSVLDQLIAGSHGQVTTQEAVELLGYTDASLLERTVDALGSNDGAEVFRIIDEVVAAGHEPRRFVEDLLQRLRDLVVCALAGERAATILAEVPADQLVVMHAQANRWGTRLLSRRADVVEGALRTMSGATAPRLQLELLMARLLVSDSGSATAPASAATISTQSFKVEAPTSPPAASSPGPATVSQPSSPVAAATNDSPSSSMPASEAAPSAPEPPDLAHPTDDAVAGSSSTAPAEPERSSVQAPDADFLRGHWNEILSELDQRGSAFRNLMRNMSGGEAQGSTTYVFFKEPAIAAQFQRLEGDTHLGAVLGAMVGGEVVVRSAPLADRESLLAAGDDSVAGRIPGDSAGAQAQRESEAAELSAGDTEVAETVILDPAVADAPPAVDPDGVYKGRPAVDVFLDIVGGTVIEEEVIGPAADQHPPDQGGYMGDDVPPEFDLEDR